MSIPNSSSAPQVGLSTVLGPEVEPLMQDQAKYLSVVPEEQEDLSHLDDDALWLHEERLLHQSLHWLRRPSITMIGLCLFLLTFAISSAESARQVVQYKLACNSVASLSRSKTCDPTEAQILVLTLQQALQVTLALANVIALAKVPSLSDQYGRRRFLILLATFFLIGRSLRYMVTSCYPSLHITLIVACEIISSLFGGVVTMLALCNCYASDIASPDQRTHYLGVNMAFFFVGLSTGPMVGNFLLSYFPAIEKSKQPHVSYGPNLSFHDFAPLQFELFMLVILVLYLIFILPESRGQKARRMSRSASKSLRSALNTTLKEKTKIQKLADALNIFKPLRIISYPKDYVNPSRHDSIVTHRIAVVILILVDCTLVGFAMSLGEIFVLFGIYRHKMTAQDLGNLLIIGCSCRAFFLTILSPLLNKKLFMQYFGLKPHKRRFDLVDYGMMSIAFLGETIGILALAAARTKSIYLACFMITALGSIASPALNSSTIKFFPESKIGEVFGAMSLAKNAFNISFPLIFLGLYKYSLKKWQWPELVLYIAAGTFFVSFLAATFAIYVLEKEDKEKKRRESNISFSDDSSVEV